MRVSIGATIVLVSTASDASAQPKPGWVLSHQKISDTEGGFKGILDDGDVFGVSVASLGDLDGDGVGDLAVGAAQDDDGGRRRGAGVGGRAGGPSAAIPLFSPAQSATSAWFDRQKVDI